MIVFVFGNPDVDADALPLRILPALAKKFPEVQFIVRDPNEEWETPEVLWAIDTVVGITAVTLFSDLQAFANAPRATMHDYDALANLLYLQKLGKLKQIKIIGIPPTISDTEALLGAGKIISSAIPP